MVLGVPPRPGRLRHAGGLELKIGGAESNLAVALSRLGLSAGWAGYLGDDEPGQLVLDRIRADYTFGNRSARTSGSITTGKGRPPRRCKGTPSTRFTSRVRRSYT